ncbi:MAG TPA: hypothetical protein VIU33_07195, partial [Nitrospiria bacterium]
MNSSGSMRMLVGIFFGLLFSIGILILAGMWPPAEEAKKEPDTAENPTPETTVPAYQGEGGPGFETDLVAEPEEDGAVSTKSEPVQVSEEIPETAPPENKPGEIIIQTEAPPPLESPGRTSETSPSENASNTTG